MRILIVEDDVRIARSLAEHLRRQRHVVDVVGDGASGLEFAENAAYELLLIDIMLPKLDGLTLCSTLRARRFATPVMMLTARDTVQDKVDALDAGADDYLTKPFDLSELSARIRALGRRGALARPPLLRHGCLTLDQAAKRIYVGESILKCTPTEFAILETMMRSPRQIFSREMLLERVSPLGSETADVAIKVHIANLRRKLRAAGCKAPVIETMYGNGYRLADV
jgi:two-component system, OmpR family, response regulator QseB